MKRRHKLLAATVAVAVGASIGVTGAAFSAAGSSPSNTFVAAADWAPPNASPTTIQKTQGGTENYVKQGGTYYVYAQVTDSGNPAAGVAASGVTADVSSITSGQTAAPLSTTGGPWTVNGTSYNRRSAQLTATNPLAEGSKNWTVTSSDTSSPVNTGTSGNFSATADNTQPTAADIQTTNAGTNGQAEAGDQIVFTYSEALDPGSILAGWTGTAPANVVVQLNNAGGGDSFEVWNSGNSAMLPLTSANGVSLGRKDYSTTNITFGVTGTPSTMVQSGAVITVTLGTGSAVPSTAAAAGSMSWTPGAAPYDAAGNAVNTTARAETGTADKDF